MHPSGTFFGSYSYTLTCCLGFIMTKGRPQQSTWQIFSISHMTFNITHANVQQTSYNSCVTFITMHNNTQHITYISCLNIRHYVYQHTAHHVN